MRPRATALTITAPAPGHRPDTAGPERGPDLEPERDGYLAARWQRPADLHAGDWIAAGNMIRARLTRRYRRFLGQVAPSSGRRD